MADMFAKGVRSFASDQPQSFYSLLLASPGPIALPKAKACAKQCADQVKALGSQATKMPSLSSCVQPPAVLNADEDVDGDDEHGKVGGAIPVPPPMPPLAGPPALAFHPVIVGDADGAGADDVGEFAAALVGDSNVDGDDEVVELEAFCVEGASWARPEGSSREEKGFRVACPWHPHCGRPWRSIAKDRQIFGARSCEYFLGCYAKAGLTMPAVEHKFYRPSRADNHRYILENDAEMHG